VPPPQQLLRRVAKVDLTDDAAVSGFVDDTATRCGRLDVVVNAAGRWTDAEDRRFADARSDDSAKLLDVDVLGTFGVCKAALGHLKASGSGAIVNFTTAYGLASIKTIRGRTV
jgi:NAD(P)-dependent dehydrogenase (short-subunit alcohol dehydrogenase family)